MKTNLSLIFTILAIIGMGILFAQMSSLKKENDTLKKNLADMNATPSDEESFELAHYMNVAQVHFSKLYFAAEAGNKELTSFYLHELEENFEEIVNANVVDEGHNISAHARQFGLDPIERMHDAVENNGLEGFGEAYENLINNCNACHIITDHKFIQIQLPERPPFDNQSFEVN